MNPAYLKRIAATMLFGVFVMLAPLDAQAQNELEKKTPELLEEDEGPIMYKFEPDFLGAEEKRKEKILTARAAIDTMSISERKRKKLLKDLYKNGISERLSKALLAETKFEDENPNDN